MRSYFGKKIVAIVLVLSFVATPALFARQAYAQGGTVGMAGCLGPVIGGVIAIGAEIWQALTSVPIDHPGISSTAIATNSEVFIKCVLDALVKVLKRALIAEITASIVRWINSGFEGSPDFVQNPEAFFTDMADRAAGDFIGEIGLGFVCRPFQLQIQIALNTAYFAQRRNQNACTLTRVMANIDNFYAGLSGVQNWDQWLAVSTHPENNPVTAFYNAQTTMGVRIGNSIQNWGFNLSVNGGFLGVQQCVKESTTLTNADGTPVCMEYETLTPGQLAQNAVDKVTGTGFYQLEIADSIDEIVDALMAQLMQIILTDVGGLFGTTEGGDNSYITRMTGQTGGNAETVLRQELISEIQASLNSLIAALNTSTDPAVSAQIQRSIDFLRNLLLQVQAATSLEQLLAIQQQYLHPPAGISYVFSPPVQTDVPPPPDTTPPTGP